MDPKPPSRGAGDFLVRSMKKHSLRTKERVLEKLGKSEKTQDELFDEYVNNIGKQQNNALRSQKELKNYLACVKAMEVATKSLNDAITDFYEPEWPGHPQLQPLNEELQLLATDRSKSFGEDLQNNMQLYLNQFEPAKTKINKRNRKLVDFDAARYNLQAQLNAAKRNDAKAAKAQDELNATQKLYESMNDELHRELPALYDSRLGFYGNTFKCIWESEAFYDSDSGKCFEKLAGFAGTLADQGRSSYKIAPSLTTVGRRPTISGPIHQDSVTSQTQSIVSPTVEYHREIETSKNGEPSKTETHVRIVTPVLPQQSDVPAFAMPKIPSDTTLISEPVPLPGNPSNAAPAPVERTSSARVYPQLPSTDTLESMTKVVRLRRPSTPSSDEDQFVDVSEARSPVDKVKLESLRVSGRKDDESSDTEDPSAEEKMERKGSKTNLHGKSYKILYKVRATNPYSAEDNDELNFEAGDIIWVIPYDNPDEQFIGPKAEIMCTDCGEELHIGIPTENLLDALENVRVLSLRCCRCGTEFTSRHICDLMINKLAEVTRRSFPNAEQSENQLTVKAGELNYLISSLRPVVASTSFALGIAYRELANVYEKLGQMDKCVIAYKLMIPVVEKHLHHYDQNIFDGLSRVIVYHLERREIAECLPYIDKAWERLQKIPGKESFDFYVVDKLRNAVQNKADFSFSKFCTVKPT